MQSVISKANLEVQECLPMSKLFNQEKRSKEKRVTLVKLVNFIFNMLYRKNQADKLLNTWGSCVSLVFNLKWPHSTSTTTASLSAVTLLASRTGAVSLSVSA